MNLNDILNTWTHDYLAKFLPNVYVIILALTMLYFIVLTIILKYQKNKYGKIWCDGGEENALALLITVVVSFCVLTLPVSLAVIAFILFVFGMGILITKLVDSWG